MKPTSFLIRVNPEVVDRENLDSNTLTLAIEGVEDLRDQLEDQGISLAHDVLLVQPDGFTHVDLAIREAAVQIEKFNSDLCVGIKDGWFIFASIQDGGLLEYQVSDDVPGERTKSLDTYWYAEAMKLLDECANRDFEDAVFTHSVEPDEQERVRKSICDLAATNLSKRCNGSMVTTAVAITYDINVGRNIRGQQCQVGWFEPDEDDDCKFGSGDLFEHSECPSLVLTIQDCLDLVLYHLSESELTIRDLSIDGDNDSCEAIFYVDQAGEYVRLSFRG